MFALSSSLSHAYFFYLDPLSDVCECTAQKKTKDNSRYSRYLVEKRDKSSKYSEHRFVIKCERRCAECYLVWHECLTVKLTRANSHFQICTAHPTKRCSCTRAWFYLCRSYRITHIRSATVCNVPVCIVLFGLVRNNFPAKTFWRESILQLGQNYYKLQFFGIVLWFSGALGSVLPPLSLLLLPTTY